MESLKRFRFRDHSESSIVAHSDSDQSSVTSDVGDGDGDLESMTAMGIKHLCSEFHELKLASNEEFHKYIFSNYTVFIRMFEQVENLKNEMEIMKSHLLNQKVSVKELVKIASSEDLADEAVVEEYDELVDESWCSSELDHHIDNLVEILDVLLSENRFEEALDALESEEEFFRNLQFEDTCSLDDLNFYNSVVSERKASLMLKLTQLAKNPRVGVFELQKALLGLCRLGESDRATQLMLEYYDARISIGISNVRRTRSFSDGNYIRELSRLVFSLISQAARSFVVLNGDASHYKKVLIEWAKKETKAYIDCFSQYLKSVSESGGGLAIAVQAVQIPMAFCSALETHGLMLRPFLVKNIVPEIEEVLHVNVEHLKKVIRVFGASDSWVLGRYLVPGITNEGCDFMLVGQENECCMLTSSGRKFARLVKTVTEDVTTLFKLQMEGSIFSALINLFEEYILTLEKALFYDLNGTEKGDSSIDSAKSLRQQISILANLSTLEQILPRMVNKIYGGSDHNNSNDMNEIDSFTLFAQEASSQIIARFCQQYVNQIMSLETSCELILQTGRNIQDDASVVCNPMPSIRFQTFFLELRKIERLAQDNIVEKEMLSEILRELIQTLFVWISNHKDMWTSSGENSTSENTIICKQLATDLEFLVRIANYGEYFSNHPFVLENLTKTALHSAGMILERDNIDYENSSDFFIEVIEKLLKIEKATMVEVPVNVLGNETLLADNYVQEDFTSFSDYSMNSDVEIVTIVETGNASMAESYYSPGREILDNSSGDDDDTNFVHSSIEVGHVITEK